MEEVGKYHIQHESISCRTYDRDETALRTLQCSSAPLGEISYAGRRSGGNAANKVIEVHGKSTPVYTKDTLTKKGAMGAIASESTPLTK